MDDKSEKMSICKDPQRQNEARCVFVLVTQKIPEHLYSLLYSMTNQHTKELQCSFDVLCLLDLDVPHTSVGSATIYRFLPLQSSVEKYFS
jgi:hypothetical protein